MIGDPEMRQGRLEGLVALVTGGSGGIGSAIVRHFLTEGAKVVFTDLDAEKGAAFASELGADAVFCRGNHCDPGDNAQAVSQAVERFGHLDILFNNAADVVHGPIETVSPSRFRQSVEASFVGPYLMTQAALPALRNTARADRTILFTGSVQSLMVRPDYTVYGMIKHGIAGLAASLALELAPDGIRVNCVCPGPVDTPLLRAGIAKIAASAEEALAKRIAGIPIGRLILADEIAAAAAFLCSPDARAITGVTLPVDGGVTAR